VNRDEIESRWGPLPDDMPINEFAVAGTGAGNEVVIIRPPLGRLSQAQAIRLAAWLAVMADDVDLVRTAEMVEKVKAT
jgi:hypothetical protein